MWTQGTYSMIEKKAILCRKDLHQQPNEKANKLIQSDNNQWEARKHPAQILKTQSNQD